MDPAWAAILVGIVSSLVTAGIMAAVNFAALRAWMARREVHEEALREDVKDHEARIRHLEHGQPFDYVPR
jgi:hypothetical protein